MPTPRLVDEVRDAFPIVLTIEEAAQILRISRSGAYGLARRYLATRGTAGLPVVVLGNNSLRVPRWALLHLLETGELPQLGPTRKPDAS
jgi:Helix-turn-helix domain